MLAGLGEGPARILVLAPSPREVPDSSLSHMFGVVIDRRGDGRSGFFVRGTELESARLLPELERTRADVTVPEEPELKSSYGLGPAASKVYGLARGISIGGYGEAFYRNYVSDKGSNKNTADFLRAVL